MPSTAPTGAPMNNLTNPPRNAIGDRAGAEWLQIAADAYLDRRHRNWVISEEMGDVRFVPEAGVVLVHRVRAEHIARALGVYSQTPASGPPSPAPDCRPPAPAPTPPLVVETKAASRWRDIVGWLGIMAGAAVFVAALAVPFDDAGLAISFALVLRGGLTTLAENGSER